MLTTAPVPEAALAQSEVTAYFVDLLHGYLRDITFVFTATLISVTALALQIRVAHFLRHVGLLASAAAALAGALTLLSRRHAVAVFVEAIVLASVGETAPITKVALSRFLEGEALASWGRRDDITLRMLVLAVIAIAAFTFISKRTANLFITHLSPEKRYFRKVEC